MYFSIRPAESIRFCFPVKNGCDLFEISKATNFNSLGYKIKQLKNIKAINYSERLGFYYLRISVKDIPGVLAKITSNLNNESISIETILQIPENSIQNLNGE